MLHWQFGVAWIAFALAVALHVSDEANHDFLATYNPNARAIRRHLHLPLGRKGLQQCDGGICRR